MKTATLTSTRIIGFAVTTALATTTLAGCAGKPAPSAAMSAESARAALAKGQKSKGWGDKAVSFAEAAVLAAPRDAATRALLGAAYLQAGRFASAATALNDAVQLGETSGRTVVNYSLALSALGRYAEAQALLAEHERQLDPADYGLAITVAGSPQQGVEALSNALRYGENTAKVRQNLAYAFALKGDWRSARLVAAQDVTADQLDQRLGEWAALSTAQMAVQRVAALLGVTPKASDAGQPALLALTNFPTNEQLAAESATRAAAHAPAAMPAAVLADAELPAADTLAVPAEDTTLAAHEPAPAPAASYAATARRIVLPKPVPAKVPARVATAMPVAAKPLPAKPSPAFRAAFVREPGAYRVQLGSYASASSASDAWIRFQKRHPELKGAERVVTRARVNGKTYYRVAAGGFAKASAMSFCSLVKNGGGGCLAYASSRTLPGAVTRATLAAAR